jgi:hypothetical protein
LYPGLSFTNAGIRVFSQRSWIFVSADTRSSIVFESAAGALGTVEPIAKAEITATTAVLMSLVLNTDFPRIQIKELRLYLSSIRELMPSGALSQLT